MIGGMTTSIHYGAVACIVVVMVAASPSPSEIKQIESKVFSYSDVYQLSIEETTRLLDRLDVLYEEAKSHGSEICDKCAWIKDLQSLKNYEQFGCGSSVIEKYKALMDQNWVFANLRPYVQLHRGKQLEFCLKELNYEATKNEELRSLSKQELSDVNTFLETIEGERKRIYKPEEFYTRVGVLKYLSRRNICSKLEANIAGDKRELFMKIYDKEVGAICRVMQSKLSKSSSLLYKILFEDHLIQLGGLGSRKAFKRYFAFKIDFLGHLNDVGKDAYDILESNSRFVEPETRQLLGCFVNK